MYHKHNGRAYPLKPFSWHWRIERPIQVSWQASGHTRITWACKKPLLMRSWASLVLHLKHFIQNILSEKLVELEKWVQHLLTSRSILQWSSPRLLKDSVHAIHGYHTRKETIYHQTETQNWRPLRLLCPQRFWDAYGVNAMISTTSCDG